MTPMEIMERDNAGEEQGKEPLPEYLEMLEADPEVREHTKPRETSDAIRQAVRRRLQPQG